MEFHEKIHQFITEELDIKTTGSKTIEDYTIIEFTFKQDNEVIFFRLYCCDKLNASSLDVVMLPVLGSDEDMNTLRLNLADASEKMYLGKYSLEQDAVIYNLSQFFGIGEEVNSVQLRDLIMFAASHCFSAREDIITLIDKSGCKTFGTSTNPLEALNMIMEHKDRQSDLDEAEEVLNWKDSDFKDLMSGLGNLLGG